MTSLAKATALVPAAGRGVRVGAEQNKILLPLLGVPILVWTLRILEQSSHIENIIVVAREDELTEITAIVQRAGLIKVRDFVRGGPERQDSVFNGLTSGKVINDIVLIHDAARPLASIDLIDAVCVMAQECGAATAAVAVTDTIVRADSKLQTEETVPRDDLWRVQTPQAFHTPLLFESHRHAREEGFTTTDDATLVRRYGATVRIVPGELWNIKVTDSTDLEAAEALLAHREGCYNDCERVSE